VLTVPSIDKERYFSIQLVDLYTHNFDYIGSWTTGNDGGHFLIAGPGWNGKAPDGITKLICCETELAVAIYRTQLFNPADIENVKAIQAGYTVRSLAAFLGQSPPTPAPVINFIKPLTMYGLPASHLVANPIGRYLLNSPMLPEFVRDADGGITLYLQHDSPGIAKEPNWLPAPKGPFVAVMRLYWPKADALDGTWKLPPLNRVQ